MRGEGGKEVLEHIKSQENSRGFGEIMLSTLLHTTQSLKIFGKKWVVGGNFRGKTLVKMNIAKKNTFFSIFL